MFKGDYLRVRTPVTSDGVSPVVENDRIKYREDHLPLTAKKMLERKNEKLPSGLKKKIEVVSANVQPAFTRTPKPPAITAELEENESLDDDSESGEADESETDQQEVAPVKKKGGRPPKTKSNG